MRAVIGVLCSIVVVFLNPVESILNLFSRKKQQYQQLPNTNTPMTYPKLSAHTYFALFNKDERFQYADPGQVRVGIMVEEGVTYVMGYIGRVGQSDEQPLCPFVHKGPQFQLGWGRIKIRVDGDYAYQYVPIPVKDTATNALFYKPYNKDEIRTFEIVDGSHAKALVPLIKPNARDQSSSSSTSGGQGRNLISVGYVPKHVQIRRNHAAQQWADTRSYNGKSPKRM